MAAGARASGFGPELEDQIARGRRDLPVVRGGRRQPARRSDVPRRGDGAHRHHRARRARRRGRQRDAIREPPEVEPGRARVGGHRRHPDLDVEQRRGDARLHGRPAHRPVGVRVRPPRRPVDGARAPGHRGRRHRPGRPDHRARRMRGRILARRRDRRRAGGRRPRDGARAHDQPSRRPLAPGRARGAALERASVPLARRFVAHRHLPPRRRRQLHLRQRPVERDHRDVRRRGIGIRLAVRSSTPTTWASSFPSSRSRRSGPATCRSSSACNDRPARCAGCRFAPRCSTTRTASPPARSVRSRTSPIASSRSGT